MQLPTHVLLSYGVYSVITPAPDLYLGALLISSVVLDLDHLISYKDNKKKGEFLRGSLWRTRLHELYGVVLASSLIALVWFFNNVLAQVIAVGILMHFIIDFLTGETRPFYPYSNEKVQIFFTNNKLGRAALEVVLSAVLIYLVLWKM